MALDPHCNSPVRTTQVARSDSLVQVSELVWSEVGASIVSTPAARTVESVSVRYHKD